MMKTGQYSLEQRLYLLLAALRTQLWLLSNAYDKQLLRLAEGGMHEVLPHQAAFIKVHH